MKGDVPALALTAARDEVFEFDTQHQPIPKYEGPPLPIMILSPDRELGSWLSDLCKEGGLVPVTETQANEPPALLLVDLDPITSRTPERIPSLKEQFPEARILGLMGWATADAVRDARRFGVEEVLSKLTPAAELLARIGAFAQGQGE